MTSQLIDSEETETTESILLTDMDLDEIDGCPDRFVALQYKEFANSEYVRISARNEHPEKKIHASFYTLHSNKDDHSLDETLGYTIKTCLKPTETTILHLEEKKYNPRLFMYNARFEDCDTETGD